MGTARGTPPHSRLKAAPVVSARAAALLCSQRWPTRQESLSCRVGSLRIVAQHTADQAGPTCQVQLPRRQSCHERAFSGSLRGPTLVMSARAAMAEKARVVLGTTSLAIVLGL